MKKICLLWLALLTLAITPLSAQTKFTVPITGRTFRMWVSDEQVLSLSSQEYSSYMSSAKISTNTESTNLVKKVGQRLATAVQTYLKEHNQTDAIKNYQWEFNLVQDNAANAFCMPGGKIVVYEGLLPITQNESSLAIVLGHEIAHAVAKHSAEQLSKQMKQKMGSKILSTVLSVSGVSTATSILTQGAYSLGTKLGSLKYSRNNETEADYMGLVFAAMAGYDPSVAINFWQRMASSSTSTTPAFLSDHPSDSKRITNIQKWLPKAQEYYKPVATTTTTTKNTTTKKATSTKKSTTKKSSSFTKITKKKK